MIEASSCRTSSHHGGVNARHNLHICLSKFGVAMDVIWVNIGRDTDMGRTQCSLIGTGTP